VANETTKGGAPGRRRARIAVAALVAVAAAGAYLANRFLVQVPVVHADPAEHYKYGSIGGDVENGLPLEIMRILPEAFPEHLPAGAPRDYTAFGFVQEPGQPMPIGFSVRRHQVPRTGLNCSGCHVGTWRASEDEAPTVYLGAPAVNLVIADYFRFLFACADDPRFTADYLLPLMEANGAAMDALDRQLYARVVIPTMKRRLLERRDMFAPLFAADHPEFGPGRVDTFNPYKVNQLAASYVNGIPEPESIGTVDYPAIWNQDIRDGIPLNWDGNSPTIHDRNVGAAFGAGATRESIDMPAIDRVTEYLRTLEAPAYPWGVSTDEAQLRRGEAVYGERCASCHALGGAEMGKVVPLAEIGTDPYRVNSYTEEINQFLLDYGEGYDWKLTSMVKTNGYANQPLDGIWARAPYLHNGSVPTLWDLLTPEASRNGGRPTFYVGHGIYDTVNVGIRADVATVGGRPAFEFDVTRPGNSNRGHSGPYYGTDLPDADKRALIEYMKTLR
jgi:mono/diheme cytochrome c family protein